MTWYPPYEVFTVVEIDFICFQGRLMLCFEGEHEVLGALMLSLYRRAFKLGSARSKGILAVGDLVPGVTRTPSQPPPQVMYSLEPYCLRLVHRNRPYIAKGNSPLLVSGVRLGLRTFLEVRSLLLADGGITLVYRGHIAYPHGMTEVRR